MVRVLDFSMLDCASLSEFFTAFLSAKLLRRKRQMCSKVAQDGQFLARSLNIWRERDEIHCICSLF